MEIRHSICITKIYLSQRDEIIVYSFSGNLFFIRSIHTSLFFFFVSARLVKFQRTRAFPKEGKNTFFSYFLKDLMTFGNEFYFSKPRLHCFIRTCALPSVPLFDVRDALAIIRTSVVPKIAFPAASKKRLNITKRINGYKCKWSECGISDKLNGKKVIFFRRLSCAGMKY